MTDPASQPAPSTASPASGETERLEEDLRAVRAEAAAARNELAATHRRLQAVLASSSWRITAPWRAAGRALAAVLRSLRLRPGTPLWRILRALYRALPLNGRGRVRLLAMLRRRGWIPTGEAQPLPEKSAFFDASRSLDPWPSSQPLVSLVIVGDPSAADTAGALDALERQTFQDFEVVVVAPGSQPSDPRCRVVPQTDALADPRDVGVRAALGKYVCCLDATARLSPTYLEKALFLLETQGYDVTSTAIRFGDGAVARLERYPALGDLRVANQVAECAVVRRSLWDRAGGLGSDGLTADAAFRAWRLAVRLAGLGARIANLVEEPLCWRREPAPRADPGALERDRRRIAALDVRLDEDAAVPRIENPLLNLRRRGPQVEARGTVLLALPFLVVGGADRLLSEIAAHLVRRGYRVIVVTTLQVDAAVLGDSTADFEAATAEIYHLPRFLAPELWRDFVYYLFESKGIDLLWVVGSAVFYDLLPELRAAFPRLKTMDLLFNAEVHVPANRRHRSRIDLNLVENTEVLEFLERSGETAERLRLIESGVDLAAYRPGPKSDEVLRELGIPAEAFVVGYSGRLAEEKRPETFIELAARLRDDPRLWFVMTGKGPLSGAVEERARQLGLGSRLRLLGLVPDPRRYMAIYDVLLLPSRLDGRPVAVMESLAMGVPVVASRVGALPELVLDGETGFLCDPDSVADFAERVGWLADHPREHSAMRLAARRFAEERLSAERMLAEYERAIAGLLARSPSLSSR
jgi:glycosyltransferase involved in cell wall biosynthesis